MTSITTTSYLPTVPAIIMIFPIIVVFPICQIMFVIVRHKISQSKTIMSTNEIYTVPGFPSSFLVTENKKWQQG